jgi:hypothetical protein
MSSNLEERATSLEAGLRALVEAQGSPLIKKSLSEALAFMSEAVSLTRAGDLDEAMELILEARNAVEKLGGEYRAGMREKLERLWHAYLNRP